MEHSWKIYDLKRTITDGVVNQVTWACESHYDNMDTRTTGELLVSGSASESGFIPYSDLTEDDVLGWVSSNINQSLIESQNSASIASYIVSTAAITEDTGLPW